MNGNQKRVHGASMIEVLVTLVIVAFGLLGLLGLQARALSFQKDSFDGRAAAEMAASLGDRVRANMLGFGARNYAGAMNPGALPITFAGCANAAACTAAEIATRDQARWQEEVLRRLPSAGVYLEPDAENLAGWPRFINVTIVWQEPLQSPDLTTDHALSICADVRTRLFNALPADYRCYRASLAQ